MGRKYQPTGDKLSEHITEAMAYTAEVVGDLEELARRFDQAGQRPMAIRLHQFTGELRMAIGHLRAAEAIRKEISPRRQAALSREASKRRESR